MSETIERLEPAYRGIVSQIEALIMSGEWRVGRRVPAETTLAAEFGVNRSTVREAIRALEQLGLVRRHDGGKLLYVTAPREADIASRMTAAMVLHEISFFELWEAMRHVEPALAGLATRRVDAATLDALEANLAETREAIGDQERLTTLDIAFHQIIAGAAKNRALLLSRNAISGLFYPAFLRVFSRLNAGERLLFAHTRIVEAMRAQDVAAAQGWMDKHIVDFRRGYELANLDIQEPVSWPAPINKA